MYKLAFARAGVVQQIYSRLKPYAYGHAYVNGRIHMAFTNQVKLFMSANELWRYNILFMKRTVGRYPKPIHKQDTNVTFD